MIIDAHKNDVAGYKIDGRLYLKVSPSDYPYIDPSIYPSTRPSMTFMTFSILKTQYYLLFAQ